MPIKYLTKLEPENVIQRVAGEPLRILDVVYEEGGRVFKLRGRRRPFGVAIEEANAGEPCLICKEKFYLTNGGVAGTYEMRYWKNDGDVGQVTEPEQDFIMIGEWDGTGYHIILEWGWYD